MIFVNNWKDNIVKLHCALRIVLWDSNYLKPTFQIDSTLSLHKSNSCPVWINLPHVQVFILSKTCIKLIWSKALGQTTLLCFLKSAVRKETISEKYTLMHLTFTCINLSLFLLAKTLSTACVLWWSAFIFQSCITALKSCIYMYIL